MRDGILLWMKGRMDPWQIPQRLPWDQADLPKVIEKLCVARDKGHIDLGVAESLISFFEVPKGLTDIRIVCDRTASGLNDMLWAPWFPLPTIDSLLRSMEPGTWMADNDVLGEMFLNFVLHEGVQALCGVDLTKHFPEGIPEGTKVLWERWTRCAMGLRWSPCQACQGMMWAMEIIFADRDDAANVFRFARVRLNLPGHHDYNPKGPWVCKERADGSIACDVHVCVDDMGTAGLSEGECWRASQRVSATLASLGTQDAARKRRLLHLDAGAWRGTVVNTSGGEVAVLAAPVKWLKLKSILAWLAQELDDAEGIDHKLPEQKRGFLVHMVQTHPSLNPHLKGVHGTLDSWRCDRDVNGFRMHEDKKRSKWDGSSATSPEDEPNAKRRKVIGVKFSSMSSKDERVGLRKSRKSSELPEPMNADPEDPHSWEEKFGNFNLSKFGESEPTRPPARVRPVKRLQEDVWAMMLLTESEDAPPRSVWPGQRAHAICGIGDASKDRFGASLEAEGM
jgi:hypothetical protein